MKRLSKFLIVSVSLLLYLLTIRGSWNVPSPTDVEFRLSESGQPFETSQERSRYAVILSLYHDRSFAIDNYASMGTPDIGRINGHYFSFFSPATSVLALPLYILGLTVGAPQIFSFLISTIFASLTMWVIIKFGQRLKLHWTVSFFSAIAFGFATNAWGYSVTLYAHLLSAFALLSGLYMTLFGLTGLTILDSIFVWLAYAFAIFVDVPNLFIFFPIAMIEISKIVEFNEYLKRLTVKINWKYLITPLVFVFCLVGYGYFNYIHFGNPLKLSNTIPRVRDLKDVEKSRPQTGSDAVGALKTRLMLEGFRSFIISSDRGVVIYTPIILLFVFGLGCLKQKGKIVELGLFAIPMICLVLYTMFGDPYGGWAFGSRYLIASMPELCILAGIGLQRFAKSWLIKILYTLVFLYSSAISAMAPLTTNVIPPFVEARYINLRSDYLINWQMLQKGQLDSFLYHVFFNSFITGQNYYFLIVSVVWVTGAILIWYPKKN